MSRIAKNTIKINPDIACSFDNGNFTAKGKLGEMKIKILPIFSIKIDQNEVSVLPKNETSKNNPNWGTTRAISF